MTSLSLLAGRTVVQMPPNWVLSYTYVYSDKKEIEGTLDWLQSLKPFFINVPYHILVASLTLMALFLKQSHQSKISYKYMICHIDEKLCKGLESV